MTSSKGTSGQRETLFSFEIITKNIQNFDLTPLKASPESLLKNYTLIPLEFAGLC
jgi:hypothetical protein